MNWIELIDLIFQWIYYLAGIVLVFSVFVGIKQIKLLQDDMRTRNQRASFEKTIEYLEWFSEFIVSWSKFQAKINESIELISQRISDENKRDVFRRAASAQFVGKIEPNDSFSVFKPEFQMYNTRIEVLKFSGAIHMLNQLEIFSTAMLSGIADEEMAFTPLSDIYCSMVRDLYLVLCERRSNNPKLYTKTVELYNTWQSRIEKMKIQDDINQNVEKLSQLPDHRVRPLGV